MRAEFTAVCLCTLLLSLPMLADAKSLRYGDDRHVDVIACERMRSSVGQGAALSCLAGLANHPDTLVRADAAAARGDVREANRQFRDAAAEADNAAIQTRWAEVFFATHQLGDAMAMFREAILIDDDYLPARLGLARVLADTFAGEAMSELEAVLQRDPAHPEALALKAYLLLEQQQIKPARRLLQEADTQAQQRQWPRQEIMALQAAANLLEHKPMDEWIDKALDIDPHYSGAYTIPAHFYIITYRYREAVDLYRKAVYIAEDDAGAHRDLGINLLRINQIFGARHHLKKAYTLDPFDAMTVNSLRLLDGLDAMVTLRVDVPAADNPDSTIGRVLIRLDHEAYEVLAPYVSDLTIRAVQRFSERYAFDLKQPMIVELYHDHDDFGVRTVSTPGIGLLGVTFGYLTAMDSPRARRAGDFHWGSTLWHEIAHVFTLEKTNHRLPRWLSEGLSVYEEWHTGPLTDRGLPLEVLEALRDERWLPVAEFDNGFVRPSYPGQVQVSYMQAGLSCSFIAETFGHEALVRLLDQYANGADTETAFREAMDISTQEYDGLFMARMHERYGELAERIDGFRIQQHQLGEAWSQDDWISVEALSRDLVQRYPDYVGRGNAWESLAHAQREMGDREAATETLMDWFSRGGHEPSTLQTLIRDLRQDDRLDDAARVMVALNFVQPYVVEEHQWLGEYWLEQDKADLARLEFDALLGMQADNPAGAWLGRARASVLSGETAQAMREVLLSLESAPHYREAQHLLLELHEGEQP